MSKPYNNLSLWKISAEVVFVLTLFCVFLINAYADAAQPIISVARHHTVGLKEDGSVVAVGLNVFRQLEVRHWRNMIQVSAGLRHTVGLKYNGTVVTVGSKAEGQGAVGRWRNIIQVTAGDYHTVGLKSDGMVVAVGPAAGEFGDRGQLEVSGWSNIIQVAAGSEHTVGLKKDGTVVAVGNNENGQCIFSDWNLFPGSRPEI